MKIIYRIYQLFIAVPLVAITTLLTALATTIGCSIGNGNTWGYYPGMLWGRIVTALFLLPVKVKGRENLDPNQSYVFVSNHQGAFDIFLIYGFLGRNFKWMMKHQLRKMPFVGRACSAAHHIFVDKRNPKKVKETCDKARSVLKQGMSLVIFPEGARSFTGHMGVFKRGSFMLADELQLPIVPITINGTFDVKPRMRDMRWVTWNPLTLTIHAPIMPKGQGSENIKCIMNESYQVVMSGLVKEYQGFVENPDQ